GRRRRRTLLARVAELVAAHRLELTLELLHALLQVPAALELQVLLLQLQVFLDEPLVLAVEDHSCFAQRLEVGHRVQRRHDRFLSHQHPARHVDSTSRTAAAKAAPSQPACSPPGTARVRSSATSTHRRRLAPKAPRSAPSPISS